MVKMNTDIVIIGAGMSGLHTAYELEKQGLNYLLLDARDRLGGRILSRNYDTKSGEPDSTYNANKPAYDLGPSWFWPSQKNMKRLLKELDLLDSVFLQQGAGQSVYENQQGNIQTGFYGISMEGACRMRGGMRQIINHLERGVDKEKIFTQTKVLEIQFINNRVVTTVIDHLSGESQSYQINSGKVVIALPPRLAVSSIIFNPPLSESRMAELNRYPTWMASNAKIMAVYDSPFWLEKGLSGDAASQLGPLREIHDASSNTNNGYALFGFVGTPGNYRKGNEDEVCQAGIDQLTRLFGEKAANPVDSCMQDWAQETLTATESDLSVSGGHAASSMSHFTESKFNDRVIWSGAETANHRQGHNGLLEGALEASIRTLAFLNDT